MTKTMRNGRLRDDTARIVAEITGYSPDLVQKVRNGLRENDDVAANLVDWGVAKTTLIQNLKAKQNLYWDAHHNGKSDLIIELEEEIDALQDAYQDLFTDALNKFAARVC